MEHIPAFFESLAKLKVGVLGDVMLDTYLMGQVERISPEAPVPIVLLQKEEHRVGGAANVALNVAALGARAFLLSVTGTDSEAVILQQLLQDAGIDSQYMLQDKDRPTTSKTRVISRSQQMMRLDRELTTPLQEHLVTAFLKKAEQFIRKEKPDVIILEDYDKGVLTPRVIRAVMELCDKQKIITAVDPKRDHFFDYRGASIFKPNWKEVREALQLNHPETSLPSLRAIHGQLKKKLQHEMSLITLSEKGVFYAREKESALIPSHHRAIADVSGAGDTVIAVASMVFAASRNCYLAAEIANIAGGLVCEFVGTVPINKQSLLQEAELLLS